MSADACWASPTVNYEGPACCARATTASVSMRLLPRQKREHRDQDDRDDDEDRGHHFGSSNRWPHPATPGLLGRNRIPIAAGVRERHRNRYHRRRAGRRREGYRERKLAP